MHLPPRSRIAARLAALLLAAPAARAQLAALPPPPEGLAACTARSDLRVCRRVEQEGDRADLVFTVERAGRPAARWVEDAFAYQSLTFAAFEGDVDGDGAADVVVGNFDAMSNGLGVHYWTVWVVPAGAGAPAVTFQAEEFGPEGGSFARGRDGRPVFLVTEWLAGPDPAGRRGEGMYLVGRPYRYRDGRLVPAADRPLRARRLLYGFAEERSRASLWDGTWDGAPGTWLADRRAETRARDPFFLGPEAAVLRGTVRAAARVDTADGRRFWRLRIEQPGGRTTEAVYQDDPYGGANAFRYVGDAATGRLLPAGYHPADVAGWLVGRRVRLATHGADAYGEPRRVLWLE